MNSKKGSITLRLLIAIILGAVVVGGSAYYVGRQSVAPQTPSYQEQTNAQPTAQGKAAVITKPKPSTQSSARATGVTGMSKYVSSKHGFSFWYPSAWTVVEKSVPATGTDRAGDIIYFDVGGKITLMLRHTLEGTVFETVNRVASASDASGNTMSGLKMYSFPDTAKPTDAYHYYGAAVSLNNNVFVFVGWGSSPTSHDIDPTPLLRTMVTTDSSASVSPSEQNKVIQAEAAAYSQ